MKMPQFSLRASPRVLHLCFQGRGLPGFWLENETDRGGGGCVNLIVPLGDARWETASPGSAGDVCADTGHRGASCSLVEAC